MNSMKKNNAFTLVEILIVVGIIAALAALAIPHLLRARITANDAVVKSTLNSTAKAMETYLLSTGSYPAAISQLTTASPPYMNQNYFGGTYFGFVFTSTLAADSYILTATPVAIGRTGSTTFTVITGGVLQGE